MKRLTCVLVGLVSCVCLSWSAHLIAQTGEVATIDHYVRVKSIVPAMDGQFAQLYVRERVRPGMLLRSAALDNRVVLFIHGAGTPAEVAFDVPYGDYSWMAYLAAAGFDVFSMDVSGYGRSTRPAPMNDPCNLAEERRAEYARGTCAPSYPHALTTIASDWDDINAVVDYLRRERGVQKVSLVGWSQGGPRIGGYAVRYPEKVERIVVLAPAYSRDGIPAAPATLPEMKDGVMTVQSRKDFITNWDRQVGCPAQYDPAAASRIFDEMLESDPVGATWGAGVRRAPMVPTWGFDKSAVAKMKTPFLMVAGEHDKQIVPQRVRQLYEDLGSADKVLLEMACSSHNAMWETHRAKLFDATVQWLKNGKLNGNSRGIERIGY